MHVFVFQFNGLSEMSLRDVVKVMILHVKVIASRTNQSLTIGTLSFTERSDM
jgi:hypothetical protein